MTTARAFTLIDLLLTVVVIGVVAAAAVPALTPEEHLRLQSAAIVLTADLEYAQSATIAEPADPTVIRLREDGLGYWLALESEPDTPIAIPGSGEPYELTFGEGRGAQLGGVFIGLGTDDPTTLTFDPFGRLNGGADVSVRLTNLSGDLIVRIADATGSVFIEPGDAK